VHLDDRKQKKHVILLHELNKSLHRVWKGKSLCENQDCIFSCMVLNHDAETKVSCDLFLRIGTSTA